MNPAYISIWDSPSKGGVMIPPPPPTRNNLLFQSTFETVSNWTALTLPVDIGPAWSNQQTCCGLTSLNAAPIARVGSKAAMFTVHRGEPDVSSSKRSELTGLDQSNPSNFKSWYGISYYIPTTDQQDGTGQVIMQWHQAIGGTSGSPAIALWLDGDDTWMLQYSRSGLVGVNSPPFNYVHMANVVRGTWVDFVLEINFAQDGTGYIVIWMNGIKKYDTRTDDLSGNGIIGFGGGHYMKYGLYKFPWADTSTDKGDLSILSRSLYLDEVRIGNANATYNDVAPGNY